jgi:hypothetical protein
MDKDTASEEFMAKFKLLLKEAAENGLDEDEICILAEAVLEAGNW